MSRWYRLNGSDTGTVSGVKTAEVRVEALPWRGRLPRTVAGVLKGCGGEVEKLIKLVQSGEDVFEMSSPDLVYGYEGGCLNVFIDTNTESLDLSIISDKVSAPSGSIKTITVNGVPVSVNRSFYKYKPVGDPGASDVYSVVVEVCMPENLSEEEKLETLTINGYKIPIRQAFNFVGRLEVDCIPSEIPANQGRESMHVRSNYDDYTITIKDCDGLELPFDLIDPVTEQGVSKVVMNYRGDEVQVKLVTLSHVETEIFE